MHRELLERDVPHEVVRLRTRLLSADDLPGALALERGCVAVRCYVVERGGDPSFAAVLVPAGLVPSPALLLEGLDACTVRPARPEEVNAATDYAAGLVCPVGLPEDVELLADRAVAHQSVSYTALGEGGVALGIRTDDLLAATGARLAPLTAPESDRADAPDEPPRVVVLDAPREARPKA